MTLMSAVIDRHSMEALIAMAHEEGLLNVTRPTDGVFERICERHVDYRHREQILEQIVLTPTLAFHDCNDFLWNALAGELKSEGNIITFDDAKTDVLPEAESLSFDIIAGLIRAAGHDIPTSAFAALADAVGVALREEDEYESHTGKEPPSMFAETIKRIVAPRHKSIYTEQEIEDQRRRNKTYDAFKPIATAIEEYMNVAAAAEKHDMLVKTPIFGDDWHVQLVNPNLITGAASEELVLFRVVATQLGKLTFRPTIKGSLELARDPATIALREQLQLWRSELPGGNEANIKTIQKEIQQATKAMSRLTNIGEIGTITTWLSVPTALVELVLGLPPVLGISIGMVGKMSSAGEMAITRKYKWAMFGNSF